MFFKHMNNLSYLKLFLGCYIHHNYVTSTVAEKTRKKIPYVICSLVVLPLCPPPPHQLQCVISTSSAGAVRHSWAAGSGEEGEWGTLLLRNCLLPHSLPPPTHITRSVSHYLRGPSVYQDALWTLRRNALAHFSLVSAPRCENTLAHVSNQMVARHIRIN